MSSGKAPSAFPDAEAKLAQPIKQSAFERSRAEAEAKRKRDQAETEAVYKEFVKSFDHDDDGGRLSRPMPSQSSRPRISDSSVGFNTGRRHFAASAMKKSGPGTLGPAPGYDSRRSFNDYSRPPRVTGSSAGSQELHSNRLSVSAFNSDSDEDEVQRDAAQRAELKAVAKPQLRMMSMPAGVSPAAIRALLPDLKIEAVKIESTSGPSHGQKRLANAVITLARDTPGSAMDAAVSSLQNRYLGTGNYLSIQRHLSSAVLNPAGASPGASSAPLPFGAKAIEQNLGPRGNNTYQSRHRGFAPPSSYARPGTGLDRLGQFYVPVTVPDDLKLFRQIHSVVERIIQHGAAHEARLMSRPDIQRDEKWSWLWDSKSTAGVYYRWRLWQLNTAYKPSPQKEPHVRVCDENLTWKAVEHLPFENVSEFREIASDPDYNSSDEEDDLEPGNAGNGGSLEAERPYLSPLDQARLAFLLSRLPESHSKLRKRDVARVSVFALSHADRGPAEIVDMIVTNIAKPFVFTTANPEYDPAAKPPTDAVGPEDASASEAADTSAASLVGLYIVSDILATAATTVYRHTWRYRGLFEKSLKERQVFEHLGSIPEKQGWGRLRAEKWRRSIKLILNLWEGWSVFPTKTLAYFTSMFEDPPSLQKPENEPQDEVDKGKWKAVGLSAAGAAGNTQSNETHAGDVGGVPIQEADVQGEAVDDEDVAGVPVEEDDIQGEPIDDDDVEGEPIDEDDMDADTDGDTAMKATSPDDSDGPPGEKEQREENTKRRNDSPGVDGQPGGSDNPIRPDSQDERNGPPRKRMRAVDMFADSL
ncbi:hypothetical protein JDV02_008498 [Purpureocillium takamizusanense]|uniref:CID domain-containing protein n=1 Tax=Purpureocillium takamizusanense TaxID=2060973 RepID=A0A9Q8QKA7_9HYPO|nr:uncharacterized protein JDV02_008498 [Purpureocillium takamizusanense]UNI22629.1 hypothetical protein JDV02_008498 [Purpureocillium takamizusanense]